MITIYKYITIYSFLAIFRETYEYKSYAAVCRLFVKFAGVGAKGTKLKETAWEEVASMINRFVFAHPNIYRNHAFNQHQRFLLRPIRLPFYSFHVESYII
jgi:hypothetical protein